MSASAIRSTVESGPSWIISRFGSGRTRSWESSVEMAQANPRVVRLLSGAERPSSGKITRKMSVTWPIALGEAFHNGLTGLDNLRLICRIYGVDYRDKIDFVEEFSELGIYMREPLRNYSSGMRARLAFAISMIIEFDCYLIDEVVAVGDSRFHEKCQAELFEKRKDRGMVVVSHDPGFIRLHCQDTAVLVERAAAPFRFR